VFLGDTVRIPSELPFGASDRHRISTLEQHEKRSCKQPPFLRPYRCQIIATSPREAMSNTQVALSAHARFACEDAVKGAVQSVVLSGVRGMPFTERGRVLRVESD
jgi:hypothetical protein